MTDTDGRLNSFLRDRENIAHIAGSKFFLLVWPIPYGSRIKMFMWTFPALAIAYTIVQGTKWLLKVRKIKKFISNFVQYDLFKYMDEENNNGIKQK